MVLAIENHPSGAEAQDSWGLACGTAEAVPFQSKNFMNFHVHAIALTLVPTACPCHEMQAGCAA
jgi:hypothetical protein